MVKAKTPKQTVLDEKTSGRVLAEYLVIEDVETGELNFLERSRRRLNYREIALTFRVSEVLGIPDAFVIAPVFEKAFARVRALTAFMKTLDQYVANPRGGGES